MKMAIYRVIDMMGIWNKKKALSFLMVIAAGILFSSCYRKGADDVPVPKEIRFYPYGIEIPYDDKNGTLAASRFIEIRVIDTADQFMTNTNLSVSTDSGATYQSLTVNSEGKWVVDPTGKTSLYAKTGDVVSYVTLNTDNLMKIDLSSSVQFNGEDPAEFQGPFHSSGTLTLTPNTLLNPTNVPANLYHILYRVDWNDNRTEVQRVQYNSDFALNLADFSNVSQVTTCVLKNSLAIIENNRIVYETGLSKEATVIFFY